MMGIRVLAQDGEKYGIENKGWRKDMAFARQEFMTYMHTVKGNNNPGAYANGLGNIEKLLSVDIDAEWEKDMCGSLYQLLQALRKNPEKIGKNEHSVRQYAMNLKKYIEYREWKKTGSVTVKNSIKEKIKYILDSYKNNFVKVDESERYKWEAVAWYKQNWDIDAEDFGTMVEMAFAKTGNLLTAAMYYAYKMLVLFSKESPEKVRELFRMLYDEELSLEQRYNDFRKGFDGFIDVLKQKEDFQGKSLQHYQDLHAVSVYLYFEYPEKYYIYKSKMYTTMRDRIGFIEEKTKTGSILWKFENHARMCDQILEAILEDDVVQSMSKSRLNTSCYGDSAYHLLAMDVAFYGAIYMTEKDFGEEDDEIRSEEYWPPLEEYSPKISAEEWKNFLLEDCKDYPSTLKMLKAMLELGGEATCKRLSIVLGGHPSSWVSRGNSLGQRVKKKYGIKPCMDGDKERFFPVPFIGHWVIEDGVKLYAWKLRDELEIALKDMDLGDVDYDCAVTDVQLNTILYGPPGTGKTYHTVIYAVAIIENKELDEVADEAYEEILARYNDYKASGRIIFTTFHQSYGYEEFIEGIKPVVMSNEEKKDIQYDVFPGIFNQFCQNAYDSSQNNNYVFIIDEINRGNISKIFGELITLIEPSKRLGEAEEMEVVLPYSGEAFGVPNNVYIIGTMNTADRSIASIDTALRRRFYFKEMMPDSKILKDIYVEDISISDMLERMNKKITVLYDREHTIGHAYFTKLKDEATIDALATIFENNIIPLLQEYFYDDYEKIRLILGDNKKESDIQFIVAKSNDYAELFGDISIDFDEACSYEINKNAFDKIEAYRSI